MNTRRAVQLLTLLSALTAGCAKTDSVPYCSSDALGIATPSSVCRAEPEAVEFEAALTTSLEASAGSSLVHVGVDSDSTVSSVCVERGPGPTGWRDRMHVATQLEAVLALPPGPACLAGTRLAINRIGARMAKIESLLLQCSRRNSARRDQDPSLGRVSSYRQVRILQRELRDCIHYHQVERRELWVFDPRYSNSPLVFIASRDDAERRNAIRACANLDVVIGRSAFVSTVASAQSTPELFACLADQGWQPFR